MYKNNFGFLRTFFAILVIISHSYDLLNKEKHDWLNSIITGASFGYLGVRGFFTISGYLVFYSLLRSGNFVVYLWKRILRIFPALFVLLIITLLLLPLVYNNEKTLYLINKEVWTYLPNNISLFHLQYEISGVFENNPLPKIINGSLWTLRYEVFFYLLLSSFLLLKKNIRLIRILLIISYLINYFLYFYFTENNPSSVNLHFTNLSLFFLAGSILASFNFDRLKNTSGIFCTLFIVYVFICCLSSDSFFNYSQYLFLPIIILSFGQMSTPFINVFNEKIGDLSYGIYISAFLIQQILLNFYNLEVWELIFSTILLSCIYGYFSWNFIEKRALKFKSSPPNFIIYFKRKKS